MQTTPLAKAITTLEGQLIIASDAILAGLAAVPAHVLSPKIAAIVIGAQHIALLIQRGVLKAKGSSALTTVLDSPDPWSTVLADLKASVAAPITEHPPGREFALAPETSEAKVPDAGV